MFCLCFPLCVFFSLDTLYKDQVQHRVAVCCSIGDHHWSSFWFSNKQHYLFLCCSVLHGVVIHDTYDLHFHNFLCFVLNFLFYFSFSPHLSGCFDFVWPCLFSFQNKKVLFELKNTRKLHTLCVLSGLICDLRLRRLRGYLPESTLTEENFASQSKCALFRGHQPRGVLPDLVGWPSSPGRYVLW